MRQNFIETMCDHKQNMHVVFGRSSGRGWHLVVVRNVEHGYASIRGATTD